MNLSFHPATGTGVTDPTNAILAHRIARGERLKPRHHGMGAATPMTIQQQSSTIGSMVASAVAFIPGVGPIAGAAVALATQFAVAIETVFAGCGAACVQETQFVNQVEPYLQQNVAAYTSQPVRTRAMQAAALAVFDGTWAKVVQFCGQASFGTSGQHCISDRQEGACVWQSPLNSWQQQADGTWQWAPSGKTGCSNWFLGYRDPIANDPGVVSDASLAANTPAAGANAGAGGALFTTATDPVTGSTTVTIGGVGTFPLIAVVGVLALVMAAVAL